MTRAIRKHLRDFIAILFLVVVAAGVAGYILSNQRFYLPAWVPVVGSDFYEVEAEFATGQAVVPGQIPRAAAGSAARPPRGAFGSGRLRGKLA